MFLLLFRRRNVPLNTQSRRQSVSSTRTTESSTRTRALAQSACQKRPFLFSSQLLTYSVLVLFPLVYFVSPHIFFCFSYVELWFLNIWRFLPANVPTFGYREVVGRPQRWHGSLVGVGTGFRGCLLAVHTYHSTRMADPASTGLNPRSSPRADHATLVH